MYFWGGTKKTHKNKADPKTKFLGGIPEKSFSSDLNALHNHILASRRQYVQQQASWAQHAGLFVRFAGTYNIQQETRVNAFASLQ